MVTYDQPNDTGLRGPIPRDARLIALILSSMGVSDIEPAMLLQLLEFAHRYTYDVLTDALVYSDHANSRQAGTNLSLDDLNLAIHSRVNHSFTGAPDKDMLLSLASTVNAIPLPPISDRHGIRLPPPQHCLTNVNFGIVPNPPPADFDDFEEQQQQQAPIQSLSSSHAVNTNGEASQASTAEMGTQASVLFDTNPTTNINTTKKRRPLVDETVDYDNDNDDDDDDGEGDDGDVSMTTVEPTQSQSLVGGVDAGTQSQENDQPRVGDEFQRGVKRNLDEDQDYD